MDGRPELSVPFLGRMSTMKEKLPEIYKNRARLLKLSLENNLSAAVLNQMVAPMEGKSEEEKERMAEKMIEAILRNYQKDGAEAGLWELSIRGGNPYGSR